MRKIIFCVVLVLSFLGCKKQYDFRLTDDQKSYLLYKENDILKLKSNIDSIWIIAKGYYHETKEGNYTAKFSTKSDELISIELLDYNNQSNNLGYCKVNTFYESVYATYDLLINNKDYFFSYTFKSTNDNFQEIVPEIILNNRKYNNIIKLYTSIDKSTNNKGILYFSKSDGFIQLITYENKIYN